MRSGWSVFLRPPADDVSTLGEGSSSHADAAPAAGSGVGWASLLAGVAVAAESLGDGDAGDRPEDDDISDSDGFRQDFELVAVAPPATSVILQHKSLLEAAAGALRRFVADRFVDEPGDEQVGVAVVPAAPAPRPGLDAPAHADGDDAADHDPHLADPRGKEMGDAILEVSSCLARCVNIVGDAVDESRKAMARHYFEGKVHVSSLASEADRFGLSSGQVSARKRELASLALMTYAADSLHAMNTIVEQGESSGFVLQTWSEVMKYDETPMRVQVRDKDDSLALRAASQALGYDSAFSLGSEFDAGAQNILYGTRQYSMLLSKPGHHLLFIWNLPMWHMAMECETSGAFLAALLKTRLDASSIAKRFRRQQRVCTTDGASSIAKVEQALEFVPAYRGYDFLHCKCWVHRFSNVYTTCMRVFASDTSVVLHVNLVLQDGASITKFRRILRELVDELLERITVGSPTAHCDAHRARVADIFFKPLSKKDRLRRTIILTLANGDWQQEGTIRHFCGPGCCSSRSVAVEQFRGYFLRALCPTSPPKYPRDCWVGQLDALDWVGGCRRYMGSSPLRSAATPSARATPSR